MKLTSLTRPLAIVATVSILTSVSGCISIKREEAPATTTTTTATSSRTSPTTTTVERTTTY